MLDLTRQERQVILFLITIALIGMGINFAVKVNSRVERIVKVTENISKIDINKANLEDLLHSPGITEKLVEKIIAYRNSHGPFQRIEDLKEIKGIGDCRYEKLKEVFFVE